MILNDGGLREYGRSRLRAGGANHVPKAEDVVILGMPHGFMAHIDEAMLWVCKRRFPYKFMRSLWRDDVEQVEVVRRQVVFSISECNSPVGPVDRMDYRIEVTVNVLLHGNLMEGVRI
mmetsp:Transcript_4464/g.6628  ORF Transcript_4464/g.6628 Transcript_4464/m.6628 type:complete len:118 (-) Transcript_4464:794-1147(-)